MERRDKRLAVCEGNHGLDEACCIRTATFKAKYAPMAYQFPLWKSEDWTKLYNRRTAIENSYSIFKSDDGEAMTVGRFKLKGLVNVTLLSLVGWVAVNLHRRRLERERAPSVDPPGRRRLVGLAA